jgi:hypothetical protein
MNNRCQRKKYLLLIIGIGKKRSIKVYVQVSDTTMLNKEQMPVTKKLSENPA